MALDRETTLKKAEKLLRQGRLDAAIAEYRHVVDDQPRDWNTSNLLGDLYVRAGQPDKALEQFNRIAEHFSNEGFYPKAAALYKKSLKIKPDDESIQLLLADVSAKQGLLADAKAYLNAVAARRKARGDQQGAAAIAIRLGSLDPADFEARIAAARALEVAGDIEGAASRFRALHADLTEKGRHEEAFDALRQAVRLNPHDRAGRAALAKTAIAAGNFEAAREFIDPESAAGDPSLFVTLVEIELREDRLDRARELIAEALSSDRELGSAILKLAWSLCDTKPDAAFVCVDAVVDAAMAASEFTAAAEGLRELSSRVPHHIPALLKLVEVCVDGGLESTMYEAQARLADAYLEGGQAREARVIAEDLVAREPWEQAHIDRFRRALVMLRVSEPDTVIADRLSGSTPFTATDPFADLGSDVVEAADSSSVEQTNPVDSSEPGAPTPQPGAVGPPPQTSASPISEAAAHGSGMVAAAAPLAQPMHMPAARPPATEPSPADEVDLTGALTDLKPTGQASPEEAPKDLQEVLQDLRTQAAVRAGADYSAQYMKLARTYLEMNMLDEAMDALRTAVRSPVQRFEAASLLGRLHMQRGQNQDAIEWLERAAEAPAPTVEDGRALSYDLGVMLDAAGETARALVVFLELQAEAGDYRDLATRIDRLLRVQTGG